MSAGLFVGKLASVGGGQILFDTDFHTCIHNHSAKRMCNCTADTKREALGFGACGGEFFCIRVIGTGMERYVINALCFNLLLFVVGNALTPVLNRLVKRQNGVGNKFCTRRNINLVARTVKRVLKFLRAKHFVVVASAEVIIVGRQIRHIYAFLGVVGHFLPLELFALLVQQHVTRIFKLRNHRIFDEYLIIGKQCAVAFRQPYTGRFDEHQIASRLYGVDNHLVCTRVLLVVFLSDDCNVFCGANPDIGG